MDRERSGIRRATLIGARLNNQRNKQAAEIADALRALGIDSAQKMSLESTVAIWWEHEILARQATLVRTPKKSTTVSGDKEALSRVIDPEFLTKQVLFLLPIRWPELGGIAVEDVTFEEILFDAGAFLDDEYWIASNHNDRLIMVSGDRENHRFDPVKITIFGEAWCHAIKD